MLYLIVQFDNPYIKYLSVNLIKISIIFFSFGHNLNLKDFVGCTGTISDLVSICIPNQDDNLSIRAIFIGRQRIRINKLTRES